MISSHISTDLAGMLASSENSKIFLTKSVLAGFMFWYLYFWAALVLVVLWQKFSSDAPSVAQSYGTSSLLMKSCLSLSILSMSSVISLTRTPLAQCSCPECSQLISKSVQFIKTSSALVIASSKFVIIILDGWLTILMKVDSATQWYSTDDLHAVIVISC